MTVVAIIIIIIIIIIISVHASCDARPPLTPDASEVVSPSAKVTLLPLNQLTVSSSK